MKIIFDSIQVNSVRENSGIFTGSNIQMYWNSSSKANNGLGEVFGTSNVMCYNINIVQDNDEVDMPVNQTASYKKKQKTEESP
ncbi:hypothetical protein ACFFGV_11940 [Pontibacillus salicampi]|uniref:Uncharacterized protein n=1 Tax=Pontibacillus salicampi TaxID=1449801 RepID=A0ABV6LPE1_9BACI